jgi:hypothetical protein
MKSRRKSGFVPLMVLLALCGFLPVSGMPQGQAQQPPFNLDLSQLGGNATVVSSTIASGLNYPYGMAFTSNGSILIGQTSPSTSGGIEGGPSTGSVWLLPKRADGSFGPAQQVIGNLGGVVTDVRSSPDGLILVDSGAASGRHMTFFSQTYKQIGDLSFSYSDRFWWHCTGMALIVPLGGNTDRIFFIVGSEFDDQPTTGTVSISGLVSMNLNPNSVYVMSVQSNENSVQVLDAPRQVAKGLRNPYGLALDASSNLVIGDNGQDGAHAPNEKGADTLNVVPRSQIGTTIFNFGFPSTYTNFNTGLRVNPQPGVTDPLVAFTAMADSRGVLQYSEGLSALDFVAPGAMPFVGAQGGAFVGFHGVKDGTGSGNAQNAFLYYDFASGRYFPVVNGGTNGVGHLNTVLISGNSLFVADFATAGVVDGSSGENSGVVYKFTFTTSSTGGSPNPEPPPPPPPPPPPMDTTPPTKPTVTIPGPLTKDKTTLSASWTSRDPESGVASYQYAIGTSPGASDVIPFTPTNDTTVTVHGLNLQFGTSYFFSVKAVNAIGMVSDVGVSDAVQLDPALLHEIHVVPYTRQDETQFGGIAMYAPNAMTLSLKAIGSDGRIVAGPVNVNLTSGEQTSRLISELFGIRSFEGWIEIDAALPGLGIYSAMGAWDLSRLDGSTPQPLSSDFVLMHGGAAGVLVNPSTRAAIVTAVEMNTSHSTALTIAPRSMLITSFDNAVRIHSSEPLAAIERIKKGTKSCPPVSLSALQEVSIVPEVAAGNGYASSILLANPSSSPQDVTLSFGAGSRSVRVEPNSTMTLSVTELFDLDSSEFKEGSLKLAANHRPFGTALVAAIDIESPTDMVSMIPGPMKTTMLFSQAANSGGLFTGLALATGNETATITIDVYKASGGTPSSTQVVLGPNRQLAKLIIELVPGSKEMTQGYIRISSDHPVAAWGIYGSASALASVPGL